MLPYPVHIAFTSYAIIGLTQLILAASIAIYLLLLPKKSQATRALMWFFGMVSISGLATILSNAFLFWDRLFVPWQDFWIIASGIALVRLAYSIPQVERTLESRIMLGIMSGMALVALVYSLIFDYLFLFAWSPDVVVSDAYYLLLPLGILLIVLIFLRRSIKLSTSIEPGKNKTRIGDAWKHLLHPRGEDAETLRSMALALSLAFLPGLQTLIQWPGSIGFILSNIGAILAIIAIALVYFNFAPEINSFMAKLVGVTLSVLLLIIALAGSVDTIQARSIWVADRLESITTFYQSLSRTGSLSIDPSQISYVISWDAQNPSDATAYRELYRSGKDQVVDLEALIAANQGGYLDTWSQPGGSWLPSQAGDTWRTLRRYWTYPQGSAKEDYLSFILTRDGLAYEIGFSSKAYDQYINKVVAGWLRLILISSAFVLLIFPLFFRRTLVRPLNNLLDGIRRVNEGKLDTVITVSFNDEIGFITESFNRMTGTLHQANRELQNQALTLEAEVDQRTRDLTETNRQLEMENREREIIEERLSEQLGYQKALSGCSEALLVAVNDEGDQIKVLDQALEQIRTGAQASRAYLFARLEDPEIGAYIRMQAEVCAPGIHPQIGNPVNQKFSLSHLPAELGRALQDGKPFGGPVKQVFDSTPALRDALLSQHSPLLAVMIFPIFNMDQLWGFIGFDDCVTERQWDNQVISMLRTASEMIISTIRRWTIEAQLRETLVQLENRVEQRTAELILSNKSLAEEILQRERAEAETRKRLTIQQSLASISTRLMQASDFEEALVEILAQICSLFDADRIYLVRFQTDAQAVDRIYEWCADGVMPRFDNLKELDLTMASTWLEELKHEGWYYIDDLSVISIELRQRIDFITRGSFGSFFALPVFARQEMVGFLGGDGYSFGEPDMMQNRQVLEVIVSILGSAFLREQVLETLDQRIAARTLELSTFFDLTTLATGAEDLLEMIAAIPSRILELGSCDAMCIHLLDADQTMLILVAHANLPVIDRERLQAIAVDNQFLRRLEQVSEPLVISGNTDIGTLPAQLHLEHHQCYMGVPLPGGWVSYYREASQEFSLEESSLLLALAEQIGVSLENYRLRQRLEAAAALEERGRLARDLHDSVTQSLYSLSLFARSGQDALEAGDTTRLSASLSRLEETALQSLREMRLLLYELRPALLEQEGLAGTLEQRLEAVERRAGMQATLVVEEEGKLVLPKALERELYYLAIEALNNTLKHARAKQVAVQIWSNLKQVRLVITDDGCGFDPKKASGGYGLEHMRERIDSLGGQLEIQSAPGEGTRVEVVVSLVAESI